MKVRFYTAFLYAFLCGAWLASCTPKIPNHAEIVILSTTDIHGEFAHLAELSAFVKETKTKHDHVIVVNAGDRFTGNPYNDLHEQKGFPIIDLENLIGVDITTVGNHEFDYGPELLKERMNESNSLEISANIETQGTVLKDIKPYHTIEKEGLKIVFLGLTNVDRHTGKPATLDEMVADIQFYDPIQTAMAYKHLKKDANVFVGLTHIGLDEDLVLADSMPELNLIIGGHSHILLTKPMVENNVTITQSGSGGKYVGKTTIYLKKGVVSTVSNEMINLSEWSKKENKIDPVIAKKIRSYEENPMLNTPITTLKYEIPNAEQLGHMMTDAILSLPHAELAVLNCPSIRINRLSAGVVKYVDILRLYPFANHIVIAKLKPADIRLLIEQEFSEKKNCLMLPAGFEYEAKQMHDSSIKVTNITLPDGTPLNEQKAYRVGLNNYLFSKYLNRISDFENTSISIVDNVINYLKDNPDKDYRNTPKRTKYN